MNKTYPQGRALTVVWSFLKPDGSDFSLAGLLPSLKYRTGRGEYAPSGVVIDQSGALTFTIPADKVIPGLYSLDLTLYGASSIELRVAYADAFRVVNPSASPAPENETSESDVESTCSLVTVAEYFKFTPVVPTAGNDGYWYINGERVMDGSGNPVHTQYTLTVEEDGTIVINDGWDDESEYEGLKDAITGLTTLESAVEAAEALRVTAESGRVSAESSRVSAETARATAEGLRAAAETSRATAETARASAETSRASAETSRVNAEGIRDGNETSRKAAETARVEAENNRATAEGTRVLAEAARATAETSRASAEQARATAESGRAASEYARGNAEAARVAAEGEREAQALADHTQAGADHTQAGTDHTRANTDHATAAADHTQAGSDHTQAGNDHTRAGNDHTQAGTDHSTASSDHTQAGNDHTQAGTDHTQAVADHAQAVSDHESWQDTLDQKANKDGYYEQLVSGSAKNLEAPITVSDTFLTRPTGGDGAEVADGVAQILEAEGNSVKFNQLIQNGTTYSGWNSRGSVSISSGKCTASGAGEGNQVGLRTDVALVSGHKYYVSVYCSFNNVTGFGVYFGYGNWYKTATAITASSSPNAIISGIWTANDAYGQIKYIADGTSDSKTLTIGRPILIDLTAMFGSGNEPATAAAVEAWLAENIGAMAYYPYTTGTVLNNCMEGIEAPGYNLLDPATGKAQIIGAYSDLYGNYYGIVGTHGALTFTDAYGNESTITPDSDGKFELTVPGELSVASAGADCAVFLWWDGTKTEYEPYELNHGYLDVTHIYGKLNGAGDLVQVWPTGMPRIGDLVDKLHNVDGAAVADRVLGESNLGSNTYTKNDTTNNRTFFQFTPNLPIKAPSTGNDPANLNCPRFRNVSQNATWVAGDVCSPASSGSLLKGNIGFIVTTGDYADAAAFKTAMNGVVCYYELATPLRYTNLVYQGSSYYADGTPVVLPVNYKVSNWSIESILPKNTSSALVTAPAALTCKYSLGAVDLLNTHTDEINNLYDTKADKAGTYPELISGNLIDGNGVGTDQEIMFRPTADGQALAGNSNAIIQTIKGRTLKWNQLANFVTEEKNDVTITNNGDGTFTLNGTASAAVDFYIIMPRLLDGHTGILLAQGFYSDGDGHYVSYWASQPAWRGVTNGGIISTLVSGSIDIIVGNGTVLNNYKIALNVIDLTQMFGAGNEPATVAEFTALFPNFPYAYNAGTLLPYKGTGIKVTGFNQWDEQWENGQLSGGEPITKPDQIRSKNFNRIVGGANYYRLRGGATYIFVCFYDANFNFISETSNGTFTAPSNAVYFKFYTSGSPAYGTTYQNDICINLSNPALNGTYKSYTETVVNIDAIGKTAKDSDGNAIVPFPTGVNGDGTNNDEYGRDGGTLRWERVDMGTLNWGKSTSGNYFYSTDLSGIMRSKPINRKDDVLLCAKYSNTGLNINDPDSSWADLPDKTIGVHDTGATGYIYCRDLSYLSGSAAAFKEAVSGVYLLYQLATPVPFTWDTPLDLIYPAPAGGTEMLLPQGVDESGVPATTPMDATIFYSKDYVQTINDMPKDFDTTASIDALATALATTLSTALDGTFTITRGAYDATNKKYAWTVTFTPNA